MKMKMIFDSGSRRSSNVQAYIESVGTHDLFQYDRTAGNPAHEVQHLVLPEVFRLGDMPPGCNKQMTVVIGIFIHHNHAGRSPMEDEPFFIRKAVAIGTKDAIRFPFSQNIFDAPRGPQVLHGFLP
jgi:hypothetical protein